MNSKVVQMLPDQTEPLSDKQKDLNERLVRELDTHIDMVGIEAMKSSMQQDMINRTFRGMLHFLVKAAELLSIQVQVDGAFVDPKLDEYGLMPEKVVHDLMLRIAIHAQNYRSNIEKLHARNTDLLSGLAKAMARIKELRDEPYTIDERSIVAKELLELMEMDTNRTIDVSSVDISLESKPFVIYNRKNKRFIGLDIDDDEDMPTKSSTVDLSTVLSVTSLGGSFRCSSYITAKKLMMRLLKAQKEFKVRIKDLGEYRVFHIKLHSIANPNKHKKEATKLVKSFTDVIDQRQQAKKIKQAAKKK